MKTILAMAALALASVVQVAALALPDTDIDETVDVDVDVAAARGLPPPFSCNNQGLEWAYYNNTSGRNEDATYSNFTPDTYKGKRPVYTGVVNTIGGLFVRDRQVTSIYGSPAILSTNNFVIHHRGWLYAPMTGYYTFVINGVDDAFVFWTGWPNAYSGWTKANSRASAAYDQLRKVPGTATYREWFLEGRYYPIRMFFAQAQNEGVFSLSITAPDGSLFLGGKTTGSGYFVTKSCDLVGAPVYPGWTVDV